jgi:DNA-binding transcriptional ArsR family regulator
MSKTIRESVAGNIRRKAPLFAALGDETRLLLLMKLGDGIRLSITQLTQGTTLSRQAVTKHLRVLEQAGFVQGIRQGRENLFQIDPKPLKEAKDSLDAISRQWDQALSRLKSFVED